MLPCWSLPTPNPSNFLQAKSRAKRHVVIKSPQESRSRRNAFCELAAPEFVLENLWQRNKLGELEDSMCKGRNVSVLRSCSRETVDGKMQAAASPLNSLLHHSCQDLTTTPPLDKL